MKANSPPLLFRVGGKSPLVAHKEGTRILISENRLTILLFKRGVDPGMSAMFSRGHLRYSLTFFNQWPVLLHHWPENNMKLLTAVSNSHLQRDSLLKWLTCGSPWIQLFLVDNKSSLVSATRIYQMSIGCREKLVDSLLAPRWDQRRGIDTAMQHAVVDSKSFT